MFLGIRQTLWVKDPDRIFASLALHDGQFDINCDAECRPNQDLRELINISSMVASMSSKLWEIHMMVRFQYGNNENDKNGDDNDIYDMFRWLADQRELQQSWGGRQLIL